LQGLLIDVPTAPATALALGNGPLLSTTPSFLSSRAKPRDLQFLNLQTTSSPKPLHIFRVNFERFHDRPLELFLLHEGMTYVSGRRRGGEDRLVVD
jgi:hypothetical protein